MKITACILPILIALASCSDFLDYKDKDKVIPSELEQYSELIYGELITKSAGSVCHNVLMMSDDVESWIYEYTTPTEDDRENYFSWYTWAKEPQLSLRGEEMIDPAWEFFYHKILMCNIIEHDVNQYEDDDEGVKYRLIGEAQAIRAMSYWYLVNLYGEPWRSEEQARTAMGVPVNVETSIKDQLYQRVRLDSIYRLMEKDLKAALDNLNKGEKKNSIFRPNTDVVYLFLSRIYLEQHRFDDVISTCEDWLDVTNRQILSLERMQSFNGYSGSPMISKNSEDLLFTWMNRDALPGFSYSLYDKYARFAVSRELMNLLAEDTDDVRADRYNYLFWDYDGGTIYKNYSFSSGTYGMNYRLEEAYFNMAEAYIQKGDYDMGLQTLNHVYAERINREGAKLEATSKEEALALLQSEKRKEFCFEDIRWFDIRRWGLSIEHKYHNFPSFDSYTIYVLEAESPNYVLPVPLDIQRKNFQIEQPERVESKIKTE